MHLSMQCCRTCLHFCFSHFSSGNGSGDGVGDGDECRTTSVQLAREFRRQFGMSIPQYRRTVRPVEALSRVRHEKVEAVARSVGYRGTKSFYRAFRELTGMTPTSFRGLSTERAEAILEFAKLALVGHRRARS